MVKENCGSFFLGGFFVISKVHNFGLQIVLRYS